MLKRIYERILRRISRKYSQRMFLKRNELVLYFKKYSERNFSQSIQFDNPQSKYSEFLFEKSEIPTENFYFQQIILEFLNKY